MLKSILLWITVPLFETFSQICMKFASASLNGIEFGMEWFLRAAHSLWFWGSFAFDGVGFLCWMVILKHTKLSVAFPLSSICFITVLIAGWAIFHEPLTLKHWLGAFLIMSGIYLVGRKQSL